MNDLASLEALIRAGEFSQVMKVLARLNLKKVPRAQAAQFANLANRVDQSRLAMRLLFPLIHSDQEAVTPPNDLERIEYANALRRTGLINEAREVLQAVDLQENPIAHLHIALCFFTEWDYRNAIPHLRQLLHATNPDDYLHTIAKVNLAAALVNEEIHDEALPLLEEIQRRTGANGQILLLGNSLELTAQVFMRQGKWIHAEQTLNRAEEVFSRDHNKYLFWVLKWRAIVASLKSGVIHSDVLKLREQARERQDSESERDFDLHIAVINKDFELLKKVYFGTRHASFRRRLLKMAGEQFSLPESFVWSKSDQPKQIFDIVKASCDDGSGSLLEGSLPHQMMMLLAADFYRPISIGSAFNTLFFGERFGQQGSANRVSRIVMRLRRIFADENVGIVISQTGGKYRLELESDCAIRVVSETPKLSREDLSWLKLKARLPRRRTFSRQDLERVTSYSAAKAKRLLRWALDNGQIRSIGYGPDTKYELSA